MNGPIREPSLTPEGEGDTGGGEGEEDVEGAGDENSLQRISDRRCKSWSVAERPSSSSDMSPVSRFIGVEDGALPMDDEPAVFTSWGDEGEEEVSSVNGGVKRSDRSQFKQDK